MEFYTLDSRLSNKRALFHLSYKRCGGNAHGLQGGFQIRFSYVTINIFNVCVHAIVFVCVCLSMCMHVCMFVHSVFMQAYMYHVEARR